MRALLQIVNVESLSILKMLILIRNVTSLHVLIAYPAFLHLYINILIPFAFLPCSGAPLNKLQLDQFTLTEVLRLHFLSAGANVSDRNSKFRYQQRGGYNSMDDAGMELRRTEPDIMKALTKQNIFDMTPGKTKLCSSVIVVVKKMGLN